MHAFGQFRKRIGLPIIRRTMAILLGLTALPAMAESQESQESHRDVHDVPVAGQLIKVAVMRPIGEGPWPVAVINHGTPGPGAGKYSTFTDASRWFLSKGYVVALPVRRGYGATGGSRADSPGRCPGPDYFRAGIETARDALATLSYMQGQSYVTSDKALIVGQSTGGFGAIAAASQNPRGVAALINFAGGRSGNNMCAPNELVAAVKRYGQTAKTPMLWIYTENDKLFGPSLSKDLYRAYTANGAPAKFELLDSFRNNGHELFHRKEGVPLWSVHVERFLKEITSP